MRPHVEHHGASERGITLLLISLVVAALGVALALGLPASAAGQLPLTPPAPSSASASSLARRASPPVYVAIPDDFPPIDARAMVVREPGVDLIVLRDGEVTLDALTMALHVLRDARARLPTATSGVLIPITGFVVTTAVSTEVSARLSETLRRLAAAESVDLGSLGLGRRVRLPGR